jgi:hypothetical protein
MNTVFILHSSYETLLIRQKCKQYILKWDAVGSHFAAGALGDSIRFGFFVVYQFHPGT